MTALELFPARDIYSLCDLTGNWSRPYEGSKMHRLYGGKSMRTKNARSATPMGFARAFFEANP